MVIRAIQPNTVYKIKIDKTALREQIGSSVDHCVEILLKQPCVNKLALVLTTVLKFCCSTSRRVHKNDGAGPIRGTAT
jgi:hypothetical protein